MTPAQPRVAFFTDCFNEANGVARTSRQLASFAERSGRPMLVVHCGGEERHVIRRQLSTFSMKRSAATFSVERDFGFDTLLWRRVNDIRDALNLFQPDVIHVTSPGDVGLLGTYLGHSLRVPLVASWHTNLHQYAADRLPLPLRRFSGFVSDKALELLRLFYSIPKILLAPNLELQRWLLAKTGRPTFLMERGVDCTLFSPAKRTVSDDIFRVGFVGRLSPEKNVRMLAEVERALLRRNAGRFSIIVVGTGSEEGWLRQNLDNAVFTGVLHGEELARAYANMDAFAFPSRTDTYGNVILEAMASGVPAVVTGEGGPKFLVNDGATGYVTHSDGQFTDAIVEIVQKPGMRASMSAESRKRACRASWDTVFEDVYAAYRLAASMK